MEGDVHLRPVFLVERYVPDLSEQALPLLAARLSDAADRLRLDGTAVSWLGSTALVREETTFCVFTAPSAEVVQTLNALAAAPYERVVAAIQIRPGRR